MEYCKYIIGIDPGINGGIVVLNRDQCIVDKLIMPIFGKGKKEYDILSICSFLNKYSKGVALLERQQPQFKDGKVQLFKTGFGFGMLEATYLGCTPVVPNRLAYPEFFDSKYLYGTFDEAVQRVLEILATDEPAPELHLKKNCVEEWFE